MGQHQGSALSPFLLAVVMTGLTDEVKQESSWIIMFADDVVICSESRAEVEGRRKPRNVEVCFGEKRQKRPVEARHNRCV